VKIGGNFLIAAIEAWVRRWPLARPRGSQSLCRDPHLDAVQRARLSRLRRLIAAQNFEPAGFAAPLGLKDDPPGARGGESLRVPLPLASRATA
jgi:hypothetical protein